MHWAYDAIEKIKKMRLSHRNWNSALAEGHAMLISSSPGEVVCITGPSRVGKTKLVGALEKLLVCGERFESNGEMPVAKVLATNCSVGGTFSSKSFTLRALDSLHHPFYSDNQTGNGAWCEEFYKRLARTPETVLRPALEKALKNRKTVYLFIDEAQHVLYSKGGKKDARAILESWKCLAQSAGCVLVLVGAYPILEAVSLCPHLLGRKHQVHIPRYRANSEDLAVFLGLLEAYSPVLKLDPKVESLSCDDELLYEGTFGCIGLLNSWIREALAIAMANNDSYITQEHFLRSHKFYTERLVIAAEIQDGESVVFSDEADEMIELVSGDTGQTKKGRKRPFQKKPRRYPLEGRA